MKRIKYLLIFSFSLMMMSCARNPVTGKSQLVLMSEAQEVEMGKEADPQIIAQYGLYDNKALQDFINEKGKAMAAVSHRPNLTYHFRVLDSDILNAFAVPGGYVYFTRGIMAFLNDEAQFAGVLGHEIGHIAARHSVIQQRNAMLGQLGLLAGMVASPEFAQIAGSASQGLSLLFLKFGRDDETQSDKLGVEYSSKIGYDAHHMASFFTTLERQSSTPNAQALPEFLSTHPNPANRSVKVNDLATQWQTKLNLTNPIVNRNSYLKRIEGLVYGPDPRQGFFEQNTFFHPELKFQFPIPQGWQTQNLPTRIDAAPKDGKALLSFVPAKGSSLRDAADKLVTENKFTNTQLSETMVNGFKALVLHADQESSQSGAIKILAYFIQQGSNMYCITGISKRNDFSEYESVFLQTMRGFKALTDSDKLNRKPERIRIKTIVASTTLQQALQSFNQPQKRYDELAILNGMELTDKLDKGMMIKTIGQ
ncbi:MAG: M48 family metalloprotease [Ferruginibacter sp.]|nr:M48 family metalloprotease [Ferruginibacter sp.]